MATLPLSNGLYRLAAAKVTDTANHASTVTGKISIDEAHRKFGHIAQIHGEYWDDHRNRT